MFNKFNLDVYRSSRLMPFGMNLVAQAQLLQLKSFEIYNLYQVREIQWKIIHIFQIRGTFLFIGWKVICDTINLITAPSMK